MTRMTRMTRMFSRFFQPFCQSSKARSLSFAAEPESVADANWPRPSQAIPSPAGWLAGNANLWAKQLRPEAGWRHGADLEKYKCWSSVQSDVTTGIGKVSKFYLIVSKDLLFFEWAIKGYKGIWFLWWEKHSLHCLQGTHLVNAWQGPWSTAGCRFRHGNWQQEGQLQVTSSQDHLSPETIDVQTLLVRATENVAMRCTGCNFKPRDVMRIWRNVA